MAERPVSVEELRAQFERLLNEPVALAVSGGADSMALMHLVAEWSRMRPDALPLLAIVTIDHGLRPQSADEAAFVAREAGRLGLAHSTLVWTDDKPQSGIQDQARKARYRMLADYLLKTGQAAVATAHNADDVAETLLMRLARGSGVDGLASMRERSRIEGCSIVRPLLGIPHARLVATLEARGATWREDPSNSNADFERVRVRNAKPALGALGMTNAQLALSARRLRRAADAVSAAARCLVETSADLHAGAFASIDRGALAHAPDEVAIKAIGMLLACCGGQAAPPRLANIEALHAQLLDTEGDSPAPRAAVTLGGCIVDVVRARTQRLTPWQVRFFREEGRSGLPTLALAPGTRALWDRRFWVGAGGEGEAVQVAALGQAGLKRVREQLGPDREIGIPGRAARTLPAFWRRGQLIWVPYFAHLSRHTSLKQTECKPWTADFVGPLAAGWP